jgi:hypothetical protein
MQGAGTYMFRIDDERVIDATRAGSVAHLINHSCEVRNYLFVLQGLSIFCWKFRSPHLLYADDCTFFFFTYLHIWIAEMKKKIRQTHDQNCAYSFHVLPFLLKYIKHNAI